VRERSDAAAAVAEAAQLREALAGAKAAAAAEATQLREALAAAQGEAARARAACDAMAAEACQLQVQHSVMPY
jgi:hypothetical protein